MTLPGLGGVGDATWLLAGGGSLTALSGWAVGRDGGCPVECMEACRVTWSRLWCPPAAAPDSDRHGGMDVGGGDQEPDQRTDGRGGGVAKTTADGLTCR